MPAWDSPSVAPFTTPRPLSCAARRWRTSAPNSLALSSVSDPAGVGMPRTVDLPGPQHLTWSSGGPPLPGFNGPMLPACMVPDRRFAARLRVFGTCPPVGFEPWDASRLRVNGVQTRLGPPMKIPAASSRRGSVDVASSLLGPSRADLNTWYTTDRLMYSGPGNGNGSAAASTQPTRR